MLFVSGMNDPDGRDVTIGIAVKNANQTIAIVATTMVWNGIIGHARGPISSRLRALQCGSGSIAFRAPLSKALTKVCRKTFPLQRDIQSRGVTPATRVLTTPLKCRGCGGYANLSWCFVTINSVRIAQTVCARESAAWSLTPFTSRRLKNNGVRNPTVHGQISSLLWPRGQTQDWCGTEERVPVRHRPSLSLGMTNPCPRCHYLRIDS